MRFGKLVTVLLALAVTAACGATAPKTSTDAKTNAETRGFNALEPHRLSNGTWEVEVSFGGIHCQGTLSYDTSGGVVLEFKGVRVEDPHGDELYDDDRFAECFTKN